MNKISKRSAPSRLRQLSALSLAVGAVVFSSTVNAQLTQNITIGNPKALGLAHAVTADPPGIDSIHFNPAGLAKIKGRQRMLKVLAAQMTFETDFGDRHLEEAQTGLGGKTLEQAYLDTYCGGTATDDCGYPVDTIANQSFSTSKPLLMLPGSGMTEVPFLIVPFGGIAIEDPNYGWTFATAAYSPQAIGYERDGDANNGQNDSYQGERVAISRITYFSPSIGLEINDELSIGASIGFSWQGFGIETKLRAPETTLAYLDATVDEIHNAISDSSLDLAAIGPYDNVGSLTLELEDALSLTFNLGLLWEPTEWISFGLVYQSEGTSDLEGDFKMDHSAAFTEMTQSLASIPLLNTVIGAVAGAPLNGQQLVEGTATLELINPAHFAIGTSIKLFPNLKVNFDIKWTDYAAWKNLEIEFDNNIDFLTVSSLVYGAGGSGFNADGEDNADPDKMIIQRQYESVWSWAIGFEYQYNDRLVVRAGYEPRGSAVPDDRVDLLAPLAEANLYTFGLGYQWDAYSRVDASFGYLESSFKSPAGESQNMNSTTPGQVVYNPFAFLDVEATTTAYIFAFSYEEKF
ncbi:hypothetical protein A9Q81_03675 [Gammaproteobacteria bacterium 42_54_T18]|nr:hypothetical protein A9Q81_03675 [Gammaproteobacteria bacterium 42_54_T18]